MFNVKKNHKIMQQRKTGSEERIKLDDLWREL